MKISEVTLEVVKHNLGFTSDCQDEVLKVYMNSAKAYIMGYTALSESEIDEHEDLTFAYLSLISDMFQRRSATVDKTMVENMTVKTILSMYARNYIWKICAFYEEEYIRL